METGCSRLEDVDVEGFEFGRGLLMFLCLSSRSCEAIDGVVDKDSRSLT